MIEEFYGGQRRGGWSILEKSSQPYGKVGGKMRRAHVEFLKTHIQ